MGAGDFWVDAKEYNAIEASLRAWRDGRDDFIFYGENAYLTIRRCEMIGFAVAGKFSLRIFGKTFKVIEIRLNPKANE